MAWVRVALLLALALPLISSKPKQDSFPLVVGLGQTADGFTSDVEVIDLLDPSNSCNLPNYPYAVAGAFGVNGVAAFCGGHNSTHFSRQCHLFENEVEYVWYPSSEMNEERAYGFAFTIAFLVLEFGGLSGNNSLASTESYDLLDGTWEMGDSAAYLPVETHQHCLVLLPTTGELMLIGGIQGGKPSRKTYILSELLETWIEGPELNVPRSGASCGIINYGQEIVVAGGYNEDGYLHSTEVFDTLGDWQFGPDLPQPLCCSGQYNEIGQSLFLVGGATTDGGFLDTVYEITSADSGWTKLEARLKTARSFPGVSADVPDICAKPGARNNQ